MNISYKQSMGIVIVIGVALILFGAVQEFTDLKFPEAVNREGSLVLMFIALAAYLSGRRKRIAEQKKEDSSSDTDKKNN
ncbi:MAG: hypothetical protein JW982_11345 [Spirochaetes bacterium]|nr:hypothetical protein [Spirochaetota bacterium]